MSKQQKSTFSVVKAVKSNARDRVGPPKSEKILPDEKTKAEHRASKHKVTLPHLLDQAERDRTEGK